MLHEQKVNFVDFDEKLNKAGQILAQYAPTLVVAYLFGSAATGQTTPLSDIDIAILVIEPANHNSSEKNDQLQKIETKIHLDLMNVFGTEKIDLLNLNEAPLRIQYGALRNKKLIYCSDQEQRIDFENAVLMNYLDFKPFRDQYNREFFLRIQETDQ